jgi:tetratricopeptide (TPR) repeat protein
MLSTSETSAFFGRTSELSQLAASVEQPDCRLIAIYGPGGIGKTRLLRRFFCFAPEPLWLEGESLPDVAALVDAVCTKLDLGIEGTAERAARAVESAASRRDLGTWVLDDAHGVDPDALAEFCTWCRGIGVRLMLTSRERLPVQTDLALVLSPLPTDDASSPGFAMLLDRLDRAGIAHYQNEHPDLMALTQWLGGVPLALELAARDLNVLSPRELRDRIQQSLLAADQPHGAPSLRAVVQSGWERLSETERHLLQHAALLPAGFALWYAQSILDATGSGDSAVPVLANLRDRFLLESVPDSSGTRRFRMSEVLRTFASGTLPADHGPWQELNVSVYFRHGAEAIEGPREALQAEAANVELLLRWALEHADDFDAESVGQLAIWHASWQGRRLLPGRLRLLEQALELVQTRCRDPELRGRYLWRMSRALVHVDAKRCLVLLDLAIQEIEPDHPLEAARAHAASVLRRGLVGDLVGAGKALEIATERAAASNDADLRRDAAQAEAWFFTHLGDSDRAQQSASRYAELIRESGGNAAAAKWVLARAALQRGDALYARQLYREARERLERQTLGSSAFERGGMAACDFDLGRLDEALEGFAEAERIAREFGSPYGEGSATLYRALLEHERGRHDEAEQAYEAAYTLLVGPAPSYSLVARAGERASRAERESSGLVVESFDGEPEAIEAIAQGGSAERATALLDELARQLDVGVLSPLPIPKTITGTLDRCIVRIWRRIASPHARPSQRLLLEPDVAAALSATERRLTVGQEARWFKLGDAPAVDLRRRRVMSQLLRVLLEHRQNAPGDPISAMRLFERCWAGDRTSGRVAANRLYVSIKALRDAGLEDVVLTQGDGYMLDPGLDITVADGPPPE